MSTITITVQIDVPEGARVNVHSSGAAAAPSSTAAAAHSPDFGWTCPQHGTVRTVPGGVSKKTGKPYSAFLVCGEQECDERPPR